LGIYYKTKSFPEKVKEENHNQNSGDYNQSPMFPKIMKILD